MQRDNSDNTKKVLILAGVAIVLGLEIVVALTINPTAALGLAPVLLAVAAIIRAITGTGGNDEKPSVGSSEQNDEPAPASTEAIEDSGLEDSENAG